MSTIGEFSQIVNEETGEIVMIGGVSFRGLDQGMRMIPNGKKTEDRHPDFLVMANPMPRYGDGEIGAGFKKTTLDGGKPYLSLYFKSAFGAAVNFAMFDGREAGDASIVVYSAPTKKAA
jgi:uncharacterized protein (DUF736 family)